MNRVRYGWWFAFGCAGVGLVGCGEAPGTLGDVVFAERAAGAALPRATRMTLNLIPDGTVVTADPERLRRLLAEVMALREDPSIDRDVKWAVSGGMEFELEGADGVALSLMWIRERCAVAFKHRYFATDRTPAQWVAMARGSEPR